MANQETQKLDNIIASRRAMLLGGGAALAALAMPSSANAAATVSSFTDFDILNFALNLEYLEANFYYMAAFGTTIDVANTASSAAGAATLGIASGSGAAGVKPTTTGASAVPFLNASVKAYAIETAIEEGKHVQYLQNAIKNFGGTFIAQPAIDISVTIFSTLASANFANVGAPFNVGGVFNPYLNDANFLAGAFIFEDVGVTAYAGAAPLITTGSTGKTILQAAASVLAVEAYHAGLIRSTIYNLSTLDATNGPGYLAGTQQIANFRATGAHAANAVPSPVPAYPLPGSAYSDDFGLYAGTYPKSTGTATNPTSTNPPSTGTVTLGSATTGVAASNIADADPINVVGFSRAYTQVLNIVTANQNGKGPTAGTKAAGGFFPSGLNGTLA